MPRSAQRGPHPCTGVGSSAGFVFHATATPPQPSRAVPPDRALARVRLREAGRGALFSRNAGAWEDSPLLRASDAVPGPPRISCSRGGAKSAAVQRRAGVEQRSRGGVGARHQVSPCVRSEIARKRHTQLEDGREWGKGGGRFGADSHFRAGMFSAPPC